MSFDKMKGWFVEVNDQWPGTGLAIEVEEVLFDEKSEYQHVVVFKSKAFGHVLVLDGVIQLTDLDERAYQEPIAHIPLFSHPNPKSVLIVGGGDGGVLREVLRHSCVERVVICEIDSVVIAAGKKYFPSVAARWEDPRVTLHCGDASVYIKQQECQGAFDVIVADTSDPVGPAAALFERPFYADLAAALTAGGVACTQGESYWKDAGLITRLVSEVKAMGVFAGVEYATTQIPTYPLGQIGFIVCHKSNASSKTPVRAVPADMAADLQWYSEEWHKAAFVLPAGLTRALAGGAKLRQITSETETVAEADDAAHKDKKAKTAEA